MSSEEWDAIVDRLAEELAAVEHARWAHWQQYLHSKGDLKEDGSLVLPATLVSQWQRQLSTSYDDLTHEEKDSDREQVRKYLDVIETIIVNDDS